MKISEEKSLYLTWLIWNRMLKEVQKGEENTECFSVFYPRMGDVKEYIMDELVSEGLMPEDDAVMLKRFFHSCPCCARAKHLHHYSGSNMCDLCPALSIWQEGSICFTRTPCETSPSSPYNRLNSAGKTWHKIVTNVTEIEAGLKKLLGESKNVPI